MPLTPVRGRLGFAGLAVFVVVAGCGDTEGTPDGALALGPEASVDAASKLDAATSGVATDATQGTDAGSNPEPTVVALPGGEPGIGFDDLQWSDALDRLIVPAGRAGYVGLLDPRTEDVVQLGDLSASDMFTGGHSRGPTSAIEAEGLVYAIDRTALELVQLDPESGERLGNVAVGGSPDYVRFVPATRELWVTEPTGEQFEIFALGDESPPALTPVGELAVSGGPESMVVAADGMTAYTNTFAGETLRIDTVARVEDMRFDNGCVISLGLTIDETGERLFVACGEGKGTSIDAATGTVLSTLLVNGQLDVIAYSAKLRHLYLNGSTVGELTVAAVANDGMLSQLGTVATVPSAGSSCVASDPYEDIWVCAAIGGQLLRITDVY